MKQNVTGLNKFSFSFWKLLSSIYENVSIKILLIQGTELFSLFDSLRRTGNNSVPFYYIFGMVQFTCSQMRGELPVRTQSVYD